MSINNNNNNILRRNVNSYLIPPNNNFQIHERNIEIPNFQNNNVFNPSRRRQPYRNNTTDNNRNNNHNRNNNLRFNDNLRRRERNSITFHNNINFNNNNNNYNYNYNFNNLLNERNNNNIENIYNRNRINPRRFNRRNNNINDFNIPIQNNALNNNININERDRYNRPNLPRINNRYENSMRNTINQENNLSRRQFNNEQNHRELLNSINNLLINENRNLNNLNNNQNRLRNVNINNNINYHNRFMNRHRYFPNYITAQNRNDFLNGNNLNESFCYTSERNFYNENNKDDNDNNFSTQNLERFYNPSSSQFHEENKDNIIERDDYEVRNRYNNNINDLNTTRLYIDLDHYHNLNNVRNISDRLRSVVEREEEDFSDSLRSVEEGEEEVESIYNPLNEDIIKSLPIIKLKDISKLSENKTNCIICMENFKEGDNTISLPCIHIYHEKCIKDWFKRQNFCPICKFEITY